MPKVTYHEYRPGRWVKMVDGEAVGPATAEEVARWQEEKAEQAQIWQDVVQGTAPASQPDQAVEDDRLKRGAVRVDEGGIWQDVVSQAGDAPAASASSPVDRKTEPPPLRTVEDAVRSARRGKPVAVKSGKVVAPDKGQQPDASSATSTLTSEVGVTPSAPAQQADKPAKPTRKRRRATPEREKPAKPEPVPEPEGEDTEIPPEPVISKGEKPPPKVRRRRRKEPKVADRTASLESAPPAEGAGVAKPRPALAGGQPSAEPALTARPPAVEEAAKPRPRRSRKVSGEAAKVEVVPTVEKPSADEAAADRPQPTREAGVIPSPRTRTRRPSSKPRRKRKISPSVPEPRQRPAYLWVMADAADNPSVAVRTGLARYEERFGEPAGVVLCHVDDLSIVEAAGLPVEVREGKSVLPRNFWIGPK